MSLKKIGLLALIALVFATAFLEIIVTQRSEAIAPAPKPTAVLGPLDGKLIVQSIDDLRVGGRKIVLCGAAFTKPQSMRAIVTEAAKRDYQGLAMHCKPVGTGTPCDGNVASRFGNAVVVQCFTPDGIDLAVKLTQNGLLCGQPAQADTTYKPC